MMTATRGVFLFASGPAIRAPSSEITDAQPPVKTYNGIPYVSGGFGVDERENLRSMSKGDNLALSFAWRNKKYLGGAEVLIKDSHGKEVVDTPSDEPLFFAKLPQGTYTVEATAMGQTLKQVAHVPSKEQAQLYFAWKKPQTQTLAKR